MKRYASTLVLFTFILSSVVLSSCKKEEIDPDLSKVFVGSWEGEITAEDGYDYRSDLVITKVSEMSVKITSTFNFIAKDPKYTSSTSQVVTDNVMLSKTIANSVTMTQTEERTVPGDVLSIKAVGVVSGKTLTISSTATSKKTGEVIVPASKKFTKK